MNFDVASVYDLRSPLTPRVHRDIKDLPTPYELGEAEKEDNPWGATRKLRNYFNTMTTPNPMVPASAENAPNILSSIYIILHFQYFHPGFICYIRFLFWYLYIYIF